MADNASKHGPPLTSSSGGCPVDHNAREAWIKQAQSRAQLRTRNETDSPTTAPPTGSDPTRQGSWMATALSYVPFTSRQPAAPTFPSPSPLSTASPASHPHHAQSPTGLGTAREVSSIPRTRTASPNSCPSHVRDQPPTAPATAASHGQAPANSERETGADPATGNWIYPSEKMFFDAMRRKGHATREADMRAVVPIHNAVNERAWAEIKEWERPYLAGASCETPRLYSFSGDSTRLSPKARINTLLGYQAPFDRHDWIVDRCGVRVEYLIDFYAGRDAAGGAGKPSFYLDVRPKLNSWEGVKMRVLRGLGVH